MTVQNSSKLDGDEVVQLYVGGGPGEEVPIRNLRGLQRIHRRAGERRQVAFTVSSKYLPKAKVKIGAGSGQPLPNVTYPAGELEPHGGALKARTTEPGADAKPAEHPTRTSVRLLIS